MGGGIFATVAIIAPMMFVVVCWAWRVDYEIEDYPYGDIPFEPEGFRRAQRRPGGGAGSKAGRADTRQDHGSHSMNEGR